MSKYLQHKKWLSKTRRVLGVMSGTSLDGIDVAICDYSSYGSNHKLFPVAFDTIPFSREEKRFFKNMIENSISAQEFCDAPILLMEKYLHAITSICAQHSIELQSIDAIGIHGQTIWHSPAAHTVLNSTLQSTLQIACSSHLAKKTNCVVVGDFRTGDVALGGEGAPLVPIFDFEFLRLKSANTIALNIGGMANITIMPKNADTTTLRAFDTGPGNVWIDMAMLSFFGKQFDSNGATASSGECIPEMLTAMQRIPFITEAPPKSTGREYFSKEYFDKLMSVFMRAAVPCEDIICTLTHFTAWSIAENVRLFAPKSGTIIISGGGAQNAYLCHLLGEQLPLWKIRNSSHYGIDSNAKEAMCFAYLAFRTLGALPSNIPSVTGASRETILGHIAFP